MIIVSKRIAHYSESCPKNKWHSIICRETLQSVFSFQIKFKRWEQSTCISYYTLVYILPLCQRKTRYELRWKYFILYIWASTELNCIKDNLSNYRSIWVCVDFAIIVCQSSHVTILHVKNKYYTIYVEFKVKVFQLYEYGRRIHISQKLPRHDQNVHGDHVFFFECQSRVC